jgi:hypothetical protein
VAKAAHTERGRRSLCRQGGAGVLRPNAQGKNEERREAHHTTKIERRDGVGGATVVEIEVGG